LIYSSNRSFSGVSVSTAVEALLFPLPDALVQAAALGWGLIFSDDNSVTCYDDDHDDDDGVDGSVRLEALEGSLFSGSLTGFSGCGLSVTQDVKYSSLLKMSGLKGHTPANLKPPNTLLGVNARGKSVPRISAISYSEIVFT
jgi:hypothetical protein